MFVLFVLGMYTETRDWFDLIPFMVFMYFMSLPYFIKNKEQHPPQSEI